MAINLLNIANGKNGKQIDPREIFMALPHKSKKYEYPRDVQSEVWKQWYEQRDNRDCIIKMNTGSGKTVVALLILQSCLNENQGPVVYVVPNKYLVDQVRVQAEEIGVLTTDNPEEIDFLRGKSILVITIDRLVNGKSIFGMRSSDNIEFNSVIVDDVHACVSTICQKFKVCIKRNNEAYKRVINIFQDDLKKQNEGKMIEIINGRNPYGDMLIPFWSWNDHTTEVLSILCEIRNNDTEIDFSLDLIKDSLELCRAYIDSNEITIVPNCIPIDKIKSFKNANRRIYMSATLPDDSIFASGLDVDLDCINNIISPEKANDVGERFIIVPKLIDKEITNADVSNYIVEMSKKINVVVLVPSNKTASKWIEMGGYLINKDNIDEGVKRIKQGNDGLYILLNKYEGIDLPDDACRLLVIDSLPNVLGGPLSRFSTN